MIDRRAGNVATLRARFSRGATSVLKSRAFSIFLFVFAAWLTYGHVRSTVRDFNWVELLWVIYNGSIAFLFLIRTTPRVVSVNPGHWTIALATSFSGLFFSREGPAVPVLAGLATPVIVAGLLLGIGSIIVLARSYDIFPALRVVKTKGVYALVRHPMYASSILVRLGYLLHHASWSNLSIFVVMLFLYDLRARIEEGLLSADPAYVNYARRVRSRFVPGVY